MAGGGQHVSIIGPDLTEAGVGCGDQMERITGADVTSRGQGSGRRLQPAEQSIRNRYCVYNPGIQVFPEKVLAVLDIQDRLAFAKLPVGNASHLGLADGG
jgi:hypothetical protein